MKMPSWLRVRFILSAVLEMFRAKPKAIPVRPCFDTTRIPILGKCSIMRLSPVRMLPLPILMIILYLIGRGDWKGAYSQAYRA